MDQVNAMVDAVRMTIAPPHRAAKPFLIGAGIVLMVGLVFGLAWLAVLGAVAGAFSLLFFRDPERVPTPGEGLMLAPADGKVVSVGPAVPPAELELGEAPMLRIAIFLSVLDVHVNRMPAAGTVVRMAYRPGAFVSASLDKASDENERLAMSVALADGTVIAVVQIAGLIARRILSDAEEGMSFAAGERFGIIRFGSRTDLYVPVGAAALVVPGQTMVGGETPVARLSGALPGR